MKAERKREKKEFNFVRLDCVDRGGSLRCARRARGRSRRAGRSSAAPRRRSRGARRPGRRATRRPSAGARCHLTSKIGKIGKLFANFWRARSRLYQNEKLQENMRLTAFFKLYKMCTLLHRSKLNIFAKNRFEISAIFVKNQQPFANVAK